MGTLRQSHQVDQTDVKTSLPAITRPSTGRMSFDENDQADRAISTSKLNASRRLHTWPINVVVYHGSRRSLVLRLVSRLDAFSGYLFRT